MPRSTIDFNAVLDGPATPGPEGRLEIGSSRDGRSLYGYRFGSGPKKVSLIAGCHADEPVGPAMLDRLAAWLQSRGQDHPWLVAASWFLVPHANPDGEARNQRWTSLLGAAETWTRREAEVDLHAYLSHVVREPPGDDLEFGFPRSSNDLEARPEARAIASFLGPEAPFDLHASFHGMAFAAGPWFLIERAWIDRTSKLRQKLRDEVRARGYEVHDIDRRGEKGFDRIDRGFTTRPDSVAMAQHFKTLGDDAMAALFRPSSMEYIRALGGDPFTLVSEMPLFILPPSAFPQENPIHVPATSRLRLAHPRGDAALKRVAVEEGLRAMPIRDQMYFQLAFLQAALEAIDATPPEKDPAAVDSP